MFGQMSRSSGYKSRVSLWLCGCGRVREGAVDDVRCLRARASLPRPRLPAQKSADRKAVLPKVS